MKTVLTTNPDLLLRVLRDELDAATARAADAGPTHRTALQARSLAIYRLILEVEEDEPVPTYEGMICQHCGGIALA
jgi:hypothetical protein